MAARWGWVRDGFTQSGRAKGLQLCSPFICLPFFFPVSPTTEICASDSKIPAKHYYTNPIKRVKEEEPLQGHNASKRTSTQCKWLNKPAFELPLSSQHSCASRTKCMIQLDGRHSRSSSFPASCPRMRKKVIFISPKPSSL